MATPLDPNPLKDAPGSQDEIAQTISKLDIVVQALLADLPSAKPWQRQLRLQLSQAARCVQVLRMSIVMERSKEDICEAARRVQQALQVANASIATGRADMETKTIVNIAMAMSQRIRKALL
jgi:hypothetical protein